MLEFDRTLRNRHMSVGVEEVGQQPARRLARGGLAAPKMSGGAGDHADPDAGLGCPRNLILPGQSPLGPPGGRNRPHAPPRRSARWWPSCPVTSPSVLEDAHVSG